MQVVGGELRDLHDIKYLLSPQDLMAVELVPDLILAGVSCFKIEGRLKGPEYVALTTKVYRDAVDSAWESLQGGTMIEKQQPLLTKEVALDLAQVCSLHASMQGFTHASSKQFPGSICSRVNNAHVHTFTCATYARFHVSFRRFHVSFRWHLIKHVQGLGVTFHAPFASGQTCFDI
jgi:collagenase-like PrtC family protease